MMELKRAKRTAYLSHSVEVPLTAAESFDYVVNRLSSIYTEMAKGHEYLRTRDGGPIELGSVLDCAEHAGNQSIVHEFKVRECAPGRRIQYSSPSSRLNIRLPWKTIDSTSNTHVWYDFADTAEQRSMIRLTIGIEFHSSLEMLLSRMAGGLMPWRAHCKEELAGLRRCIMAAEPTRPATA